MRLAVVPSSLKALASLPKLGNLHLGKEGVSTVIDSGPLADLAHTHISDLQLAQPVQDLAPLAAIPNLKFLEARSTDFSKGGPALTASTSLEFLSIGVGPGADPRPLLESTSLQSIQFSYRSKDVTVKVGETFTVPTFTGLDGKPFEVNQTEDSLSTKRVGFNTFKAIEPNHLRFLEGAEGMTAPAAGGTVGWGVDVAIVATTTDEIKPVNGYIWPTSKTARVGDFASFAVERFSYPRYSRYTCEWLRNGKFTGVKDCHNYPLRAADSQATLSLRVIVHSDSAYTPYILSSTTTYTAKYTVLAVFNHQVNTSGTTRVGSPLKATTTNIPKGTNLSHQWLRDGKSIKGATRASYTLVAADLGKRLSVKVTATKTGFGTSVITTGATAKVSKGVLALKKYPTVSGTKTFGKTLTAKPGTWSVKPDSYRHQWLRDGRPIKGATRASYKQAAADQGKSLSVRVTATKAGFETSVYTTGKTSKVSKDVLKLKKSPTVSGTEKVGKTLTAKPGAWSVKPDSYRYQWYRSGGAINKAIKTKYKFTTRDKGKTIYVKVTAQKKGYTSKSANSKVK